MKVQARRLLRVAAVAEELERDCRLSTGGARFMVIAFDLAKVATIKEIRIGPAIAVRAQRRPRTSPPYPGHVLRQLTRPVRWRVPQPPANDIGY